MINQYKSKDNTLYDIHDKRLPENLDAGKVVKVNSDGTGFEYGEAGGLTILASSNKTVNNYQVPQLTDDQLVAIYNAVVDGKPVTVTDATGTMHFSSINVDSVSGDIYVTMVYFDKMILEYSEGNVTNFTELGGGGGMTMDLLWENASPTSSFKAQEILMQNFTNYQFYLIQFYSEVSTTSRNKNFQFFEKSQGETNHILSCPDKNEMNYRTFRSFGTNALSFNAGNHRSWNTIGTEGSNNYECIPLKIYGIK